MAPHVVGFTGLDNQGLTGIEQSFDEVLRGSAQPLTLSIDLRVQHLLARELAGAMQEFSAIGAAGVVMDARTGELPAMEDRRGVVLGKSGAVRVGFGGRRTITK